MKKWNIYLVLLCCVAMVFTGCSKDNKETTAPSTEDVTETPTEAGDDSVMGARTEYKALDYVTLGEYKGLEIPKADVEVGEDEIQDVVDNVLSKITKEITDRAVAEGDTVNLDYEGLKDGVAFQGGTAQGASLTIGSGQFIPGFEDGLIGVMPGEKTALNLTFPEEYKNNPDLAGKEVVFNVTVNYIVGHESELTDEIVAANFPYATVVEYRDAVKETLYEQKLWASCFDKIVENSPINGYPQAKDEFIEQQKAALSQSAAMYGMDLEGLISAFYQVTEEEFTTQYIVPLFEEEMRIHAIAEKEALAVTDESFAASLEDLAVQNNVTAQDVLDYYGEAYLKESFLYKLVFDLVVDSAVIQ